MFKTIAVVACLVALSAGNPLVIDPALSGRAVGGVNVNLGQVPFMASLRSLTNIHFCGGSILSNRWILTSATCTVGKPLNGINVVVGTVTLNAGGVIHRSQNITVHPLFDRATLSNDISLVFTATAIAFTANVQTVALSANIIDSNVSVQVSGWGASSQNGGLPVNNLARLTLNTISNADCRSRHNEVDASRIFDGKICTYTQSPQGTCFGDEGGALISGGAIIGVLSWQTPCGVGRPDVYERIADKRLWILTATS